MQRLTITLSNMKMSLPPVRQARLTFLRKKDTFIVRPSILGSGEKEHVFLFMDESEDSFCETYRLCSVMESVPEALAHWKQSVW